ncbi:hypothetical protein GXB81_29625 [Paraburkholderia sp. Ac-20336]|uniref:type III secretion system protein SctP n=1 Tax=Paraburkholderia sp. Ac-20336 TaxID=2703886 RepID=UPI00197DB705|nr:type III secretion system protein SctP [Paraburkholderia sp. Ac-20336]MBN3807168.1 hypothetical protein [Paraburkholderia sp. Ac-20336]
MHAHSPHRVRVIVDPSAQPAHDAAPQSEPLRRQADRFRQLLANAAAEAADANADALCETADAFEASEPSSPADDAPETTDAGQAPAAEPEAFAFLPPLYDEQRHSQEQQSRDESGGESGSESGGGRNEHERDDGKPFSGAARESRTGGNTGGFGAWPHSSGVAAGPVRATGSGNASGSRANPGVVAAASQAAGSINHTAALRHAHATPHTAPRATAIEAPTPVGDDVRRLVGSIVEQVADFCSNPAVRERGDWRITVPIDSAQLPGCTLHVALSRFDLTLRFDTTDDASRQLILRHQTTLGDQLKQMMQTRFDASHEIEIIVT